MNWTYQQQQMLPGALSCMAAYAILALIVCLLPRKFPRRPSDHHSKRPNQKP